MPYYLTELTNFEMNINFKWLPLFLGLLFTNSGFLKAQNNSYRVAFYNVENLYDTINNPLKNDNEFTPDSPKLWGSERYLHKISALSLVVQELGFPEILGLSEVENSTVLNDWSNYRRMAPHNYRHIIEQSRDSRGINVAFMYKPDAFTPISHRTHYADFSKTERADNKTRDVLYVKGTVPSGDTLHLFVAHFPSRWGGPVQSEPYRIAVAHKIKFLTDSLNRVLDNPKILVLGDFNDNPIDKSIRVVMSACHPNSKQACTLSNPFWDLYNHGSWSSNYRGQLDLFDQIIISTNLLNATEGLRFKKAGVLNDLWLLYHDSRNGFTPNRTYAGQRYTGGFSDHLPVYVDLTWD